MWRGLAFFVSIIAFFVCIQFNANYEYSQIAWLPFGLLVFTILDKFLLKKIDHSYVYALFYVQAILRYCIVPIGVSIGDWMLVGHNTNHGLYAIMIMLFELICVLIVLLIQDKNFHKNINSNKVILISRSSSLMLFLLISFVIIYLSGFFEKVNSIWNLSAYMEVIARDENLETSSLGGLLFIPFKIAILLIVSSRILESKNSNLSKTILLILVMMIAASFIVGTSRLSIVTFILPFYFILKTILSKQMLRVVNVFLALLMFGALLVTSITKFSTNNNSSSLSTLLDTSSLNAYFGGVGNVAKGVDLFTEREIKDYGLFFINDIFQNVPIISKLTDDTYKTNNIFNYGIYGHSDWQTQIVPLSVAGLFHFDIFGVGLYSSFFLFLACYFERKGRQESYLPYKFVFFSIMLSLSMIFMLNVGSMIVTIIRSMLFVYVPFYLNNKLSRRI